MPAVQMTGAAVEGVTCDDIVELTVNDVADMLALVERTKPGPFKDRARSNSVPTSASRDDDGALDRDGGRAMFSVAVSRDQRGVHDESARGKGLAASSRATPVAHILQRGETPMLHALRRQHQRDPALRALGFTYSNRFP